MVYPIFSPCSLFCYRKRYGSTKFKWSISISYKSADKLIRVSSDLLLRTYRKTLRDSALATIGDEIGWFSPSTFDLTDLGVPNVDKGTVRIKN